MKQSFFRPVATISPWGIEWILVRLSTRSRQIVVDDSDHEIHLFRPDVVIQAIPDVQKGK